MRWHRTKASLPLSNQACVSVGFRPRASDDRLATAPGGGEPSGKPSEVDRRFTATAVSG